MKVEEFVVKQIEYEPVVIRANPKIFIFISYKMAVTNHPNKIALT